MRFVLLLALFLSQFAYGQDYPFFNDGNARFMFNAGLGSSNLTGIGFLGELGLNANLNNFYFRVNYNSQLGNIEPEQDAFDLVRDRYNDHFYDLSVMYGRTFCIKRFALRASIGVGHSSYTDKTLVYDYYAPSGWFGSNNYSVSEVKTTGIGFIVQADCHIYVIQSFGLGVSFYSNFNRFYNLIGGCVTLSTPIVM